MLLAILVPFRRVVAYCLAVLAVSFTSHAVAGDLVDMSAVSIIGLCIGYPFWSAAVCVCTDRLAAYLLRLNATTAPRRRRPRRVAAWTPGPAHAEHTVHEDATTNAGPPASASSARLLAGDVPPATTADDEMAAMDDRATTDRLTARQLQVVALLADGLRYREVAACLSISARQVQRHVAQAAARLGVHGVYELAAIAVSEGIVPDPTRLRGNASSAQDAHGHGSRGGHARGSPPTARA
ncbi:MAG: helix-turn-helix transcriptional regulator [Actinomycetota bacterium]|nr:helix-turn-helix transcriptional regulator [Actinomycetota bacterium]